MICSFRKEICLSAPILTHSLFYMSQLFQLSNYCPRNFPHATLTIPLSLSRWFSCIMSSSLLLIQDIDGFSSLATKPHNIKVEFLAFFCLLNPYYCMNLIKKRPACQFSSCNYKLQNVKSVTFLPYQEY